MYVSVYSSFVSFLEDICLWNFPPSTFDFLFNTTETFVSTIVMRKIQKKSKSLKTPEYKMSIHKLGKTLLTLPISARGCSKYITI